MPLIDAVRRAYARLLDSRGWAWKVTLLLTFYSFVFATPAFHYMREAFNDIGWTVVMKQRDANFIYQPAGINPGMQAAKKTFRLTVPLVAKIFHLNPFGIYALQCLLGVLFIYLVIRFVYRHANDRSVAAMFAAGFVSLFVGRACFTDIYSRFEGWAYLLIFLSVYFERRGLVFLFSFLACWTDERATLGLAFVFLWWLYMEQRAERMSVQRVGRMFTRRYAMVVYAVVAYAALRLMLQSVFGYYTPTAGVSVTTLFYDFNYFNFGVWTYLEGYWGLILLMFFILLQQRRYGLLSLNALLVVVTLFSSFFVYDVTKSGSFMFVDAFLALVIILHSRGLVPLKQWVRYTALICVLFPPYYIILDLKPYILQQQSVVILLVKYMAPKLFE